METILELAIFFVGAVIGGLVWEAMIFFQKKIKITLAKCSHECILMVSSEPQ